MELNLLLQENIRFVLGLHLVGVVIGFGAAIIADVFFFKYLKNRKISDSEVKILKTFSKIVWVGLVIIVISGVLLFVSNVERYLESAKFLTKMFVVGVIIVNGLVLNKFVTPKLTSISFDDTSGDNGMRGARKLAFASGAVSVTSWWSAFIFGVMQVSPAPLPVLLGIYLFVLVGAVVTSQIFEKLFSSGKINLPDGV